MDFVLDHSQAVQDVDDDHNDAADEARVQKQPFIPVIWVDLRGVIL